MLSSAARLALACVLCAAAVAMTSSAQELEEHRGERVSASAFGPAVVETLETMAARAMPENAGGRLRGASYRQRSGTWFVPIARATWNPHSGRRYAINQNGDSRMTIGFPGPADVESAWFAPQGDVGALARSLVVRGDRGELEVACSAELALVSRVPVPLALCFEDVDRLAIEARG